MILTNEELYKKKYDYKTLQTNIYVVSLLDILKTQKLTSEFCVKYILDEKYMTCLEDTYLIDFNYVLDKQPHITKEELRKEYDDYYE